jgi:hypothetical protein
LFVFLFSLSFLSADAAAFLRVYGLEVQSARELARFFHGLQAPSSYRRAQGEEDSGGLVAKWRNHEMWARYKHIHFPKVLEECEKLLQHWNHAREREQEVEEQRRNRGRKRNRAADSASTVAVVQAVSDAPMLTEQRTNSCEGEADFVIPSSDAES